MTTAASLQLLDRQKVVRPVLPEHHRQGVHLPLGDIALVTKHASAVSNWPARQAWQNLLLCFLATPRFGCVTW